MAVDPKQFSLTHMPSLVLYMIAEYLSPREKAILSQVNVHMRNVINSNRKIWKYVNFVVSPRRQDQCKHAVHLLLQRNATSLSFSSSASEKVQEAILKELPDLQSLSIPMLNASTPGLIAKFCKNLKKLHIWKLELRKFHLKGIALDIASAMGQMVHLEELCLEGDGINKLYPHYTSNISSALCCLPELRRLELHFQVIDLTWLLKIISFNPNLKSFKAHTSDGLLDLRIPSFCYYPNDNQVIKDFVIEEITYQGWLPSYAADLVLRSFEECQSLISLNLSCCGDENTLKLVLDNLHKLPSLRSLNLTSSKIRNDMFKSNLHNLQHFELRSCLNLNSEGIRRISMTSKSLRYLGIANCNRLQEPSIKLLPYLFRSLDTLDVSGCAGLTNEVLKEFYLQPCRPTLCPRKIIAKGCQNISKRLIKIVRERLRNQLIIVKE